MIKAIRDYFLKCDFLEGNSLLNIDYIGNERVTYSISADPTSPVLKRYTDGGALKCLNFSFNSLNYYSSSPDENAENLQFYEKLEAWIKSNNLKQILPKLEGKEALEVEVLTPGYIFDTEVDRARYVIQLRLIYLEE